MEPVDRGRYWERGVSRCSFCFNLSGSGSPSRFARRRTFGWCSSSTANGCSRTTWWSSWRRTGCFLALQLTLDELSNVALNLLLHFLYLNCLQTDNRSCEVFLGSLSDHALLINLLLVLFSVFPVHDFQSDFTDVFGALFSCSYSLSSNFSFHFFILQTLSLVSFLLQFLLGSWSDIAYSGLSIGVFFTLVI